MRLKSRPPAIAIVLLLFLSACSAQFSAVPETHALSEQSIADGRRLIASYGCGSCHSIPGIPGAGATVGPPLDRFYARSYIAGQIPNTWLNLVAWIQDPQQLKPGTAMPNLGVNENDAVDIASYLDDQPALGDAGR